MYKIYMAILRVRYIISQDATSTAAGCLLCSYVYVTACLKDVKIKFFIILGFDPPYHL